MFTIAWLHYEIDQDNRTVPASLPALWCAAMLADCNIVIVGDFLQLPPIAIANTPMADKWLRRDIFAASDMQRLAKRGNIVPENFVMLNEQFRMEKEIADIANLYYGEYAALKSDKLDTPQRVLKRELFYNWFAWKKSRSVEIIDTSGLNAWVTTVPQGKSTSRLNCFSAALVVEMAFQWIQEDLKLIKANNIPAEEPKILIIAPYRPHIDRIKQLIQFEYSLYGIEDANLIKAGTIHSFQGNEADIVIFDLVLDEPHFRANLFMPDSDGENEYEKLYNVAVTRARFKLFVVGNIKHCKKHAKDNALGRLLNYLEIQGFPKTDAKQAFPDLLYAKPRTYIGNELDLSKHIICREEAFYDYFIHDVRSFKKRLIIYSPFITTSRMASLLPEFSDAISKGKQIIVVTKSYEDRKKRELPEYKKMERELTDIGIEIIHKKGMHEKLIFVDDSAVWMGSLNTLSFSGQTGEIMHRHFDHNITAEYEKLYDISFLDEAATNTEELYCPICKSEMQLCEGDKGVYWKCTICGYSRNMKQQYPFDGILRCSHCGGEFCFAMKKQPRWVCRNNSNHYQIMRESDLRLEKMAALIPTKKERKEVDLYFRDQKNIKENQKTQTKNTNNSKSKVLPDKTLFDLLEDGDNIHK